MHKKETYINILKGNYGVLCKATDEATTAVQVQKVHRHLKVFISIIYA